MNMMLVDTQLTGPKVPIGCNNDRFSLLTAHPDEKQQHMVSKKHDKLPTPYPKLLSRHEYDDADWHATIRVQQWTATC
jgi:hypothetical protein